MTIKSWRSLGWRPCNLKMPILRDLRPDGVVYEHLSIVEGAQERLVYAAELLFLIGELGLDLGFDLDTLGDVTAMADLRPDPPALDE